jgi:nickel transport protein
MICSRRIAVTFALAAAILAAGARGARAHGVGWKISERAPVALEFFYSTGETMAYQEVKIFSPDEPGVAFLSGRTDPSGRFAFVPDAPGEWRAVVSDGEGHRAETTLTVGESAADIQVAQSGGGELFTRAALGVSVIFNAAALVLLSRAAKRGSAKST